MTRTRRSPKSSHVGSLQNRPYRTRTLTLARSFVASVGMANVLSEDKKQQVIALGRLGRSLRRIERETGIRQETAGEYLRTAGVAVRPAGWGGKPPAKPAIAVTTDSRPEKAGISVPIGAGPAKLAIKVTTDSEVSSTSEQRRETVSDCTIRPSEVRRRAPVSPTES